MSYLTTSLGLLEKHKEKVLNQQKALSSAEQKLEVLKSDLSSLDTQLQKEAFESECHIKAAHFLKELIRVVSLDQIDRIEKLVNSALNQIFPENPIMFQVVTATKRNMTEYD